MPATLIVPAWLTLGVALAYVFNRLLGDDPLGGVCDEMALVRLRETYEQSSMDEQLVEIRNLPETDPWRSWS